MAKILKQINLEKMIMTTITWNMQMEKNLRMSQMVIVAWYRTMRIITVGRIFGTIEMTLRRN